jgi:hypothetical protein
LLAGQLQHLHGGIVVVEDGGLGRLIEQLLVGGGKCFGRRLHQIPLRRGRQRDAHAGLQLLDTVERQAGTVFQEPHHAGCGRIIFLRSDPLGRRGGEHLTAQVAAQPVAGVDGRRERRHASDAHEFRRLALRIQFPGLAAGTGLTAVQIRMCHRHLARPRVRGGGITPMTGRLSSWGGRFLCRACGRRIAPHLAEYVAGGFGCGAEDHVPQPLERGILGLQLGLHPRHGIDETGQSRVFLVIQNRASAFKDVGNPLLLDVHGFQ